MPSLSFTAPTSVDEAVKILEKYHHVVTVVGNGQEALDAVKEKRYDVILMDVQMPIMVRITDSDDLSTINSLSGRI